MANTDVTIRMDETTKTELQNLMNDLGMDVNPREIPPEPPYRHAACNSTPP